MLYWKLYSQPAAVARLRKSIRYDSTLRNAVSMGLRNFSAEVLRTTRTDSDELVVQVKQLGRYEIWGMKSPTALPVRTTFLHFVDPEYVPIFDKQVLLAVGVAEKRANEKLEVLRYYLPHARELARKYSRHFSAFKDETAIRLVDMAMWVTRGGCH
jgi:hypothetical protein